MNSNNISARNYAAQAESSLKTHSRKLLANGFVDDSVAVSMFSQNIGKAVHFALPDGGRIAMDELRGLTDVVVRLPYPSITIEYFTAEREGRVCVTPSGTVDATESYPKRLALVTERETPEGVELKVQVASFSQRFQEWLPQTLSFRIMPWRGFFNFYDKRVVLPGNPEIMLKQVFKVMTSKYGVESSFKNCLFDISDEVTATLEMLEALACSNVKSEVLEKIDVAKQRKRAKAGKLPIYETRILTLPGGSSSGGGGGGSHNGPRQHLRRGHIRRLSTKSVWVNACVVGDPSRGIIEKQYRVDGVLETA